MLRIAGAAYSVQSDVNVLLECLFRKHAEVADVVVTFFLALREHFALRMVPLSAFLLLIDASAAFLLLRL